MVGLQIATNVRRWESGLISIPVSDGRTEAFPVSDFVQGKPVEINMQHIKRKLLQIAHLLSYVYFVNLQRKLDKMDASKKNWSSIKVHIDG